LAFSHYASLPLPLKMHHTPMCFDAITFLLHKSLELKITCVKKYYEELNFFLNEIDIFYFKTLSIPPKWPDHSELQWSGQKF
jgi:hypothetical protein